METKNINATGGNFKLQIVSSGKWSCESDGNDWCELDTTEDTVVVSVKENTDTTERSYEIVISNDCGKEYTLNVKQSGKEEEEDDDDLYVYFKTSNADAISFNNKKYSFGSKESDNFKYIKIDIDEAGTYPYKVNKNPTAEITSENVTVNSDVLEVKNFNVTASSIVYSEITDTVTVNEPISKNNSIDVSLVETSETAYDVDLNGATDLVELIAEGESKYLKFKDANKTDKNKTVKMKATIDDKETQFDVIQLPLGQKNYEIVFITNGSHIKFNNGEWDEVVPNTKKYTVTEVGNYPYEIKKDSDFSIEITNIDENGAFIECDETDFVPTISSKTAYYDNFSSSVTVVIDTEKYKIEKDLSEKNSKCILEIIDGKGIASVLTNDEGEQYVKFNEKNGTKTDKVVTIKYYIEKDDKVSDTKKITQKAKTEVTYVYRFGEAEVTKEMNCTGTSENSIVVTPPFQYSASTGTGWQENTNPPLFVIGKPSEDWIVANQQGSNGVTIYCDVNNTENERSGNVTVTYANGLKTEEPSSYKINIKQTNEGCYIPPQPVCEYTIDVLSPTTITNYGLLSTIGVQLRTYKNGERFNTSEITYTEPDDGSLKVVTDIEKGVAPPSAVGAPSVIVPVTIMKSFTGTKYISFKYGCSDEVKVGVNYKQTTVVENSISCSISNPVDINWRVGISIYFGGDNSGDSTYIMYQGFDRNGSTTSLEKYYKPSSGAWIKVGNIPFTNPVHYNLSDGTYGIQGANVYFNNNKLETTGNIINENTGNYLVSDN